MISAWAGQYIPILYFASILVIFLIFAFYLAMRLKARSLGNTGAANILLLIAAVGWIGFISANRNYGIVDYFLIVADVQPFDECRRDGVIFKDGTRLSICKTEKAWWRFGFIRSIVYDTSGQIALEDGNPTNEWNVAARQLGGGLEKGVSKDRGALFGISPYTERRIYSSYYLVDFYDPM
ncbi:hypothetical protein [Burkholderia ubonensis]|uniref:hypothetical protein n=1 Tax=Burkholderia ubonensis TaxID=101571 RepID=UPI001E54E576|nr:hypothetical protein [Burkholderia ubonensis]